MGDYLPYLSIDLFLIETSVKVSYSSCFLSSLAEFYLAYHQYFLAVVDPGFVKEEF